MHSVHIYVHCTHIHTYIYIYIYGNSMGRPLQAAWTNIFVGFQETRLFKITNLPLFYKQYVNDTLMIFSSRCFFNTVNQLHPALTFTSEFEHHNNLPFLDILVECTNFGLQTSIYCKPTFTGTYTTSIQLWETKKLRQLLIQFG